MNFINLIISAITALFGYRLNKILIAIIGVIAGFNLSSQILPMYITDSNMIYIMSIVLAIITGLISFKIYLVGIFLLCFFTAYNFFGTVEIGQTQTYIIGAIIGLLAGFLGMSFQRPIITFATSLFGSFLFVKTISEFLNIQNTTLTTIASIVLTVVTIMYQYRTTTEN